MQKKLSYSTYYDFCCQFLETNQCMTPFKKNLSIHGSKHESQYWSSVLSYILYMYHNHNITNLFNYAFTWSETSEGHAYWNELNKKFIDEISDFLHNCIKQEWWQNF